MAHDRTEETTGDGAESGTLWNAFANHHDEEDWHVAEDLTAPTKEHRKAG